MICERLAASGETAPRTPIDYRPKTRHWIIPPRGGYRLNRQAPEHLDTAYTAYRSTPRNGARGRSLRLRLRAMVRRRIAAGNRLPPAR